MDADEDDEAPQLIEAGAAVPADGTSNVTADIEELKVGKVPITIVTGMYAALIL